MCSDDAALCQITLTTRYDGGYFMPVSSYVMAVNVIICCCRWQQWHCLCRTFRQQLVNSSHSLFWTSTETNWHSFLLKWVLSHASVSDVIMIIPDW